MVSEAELSAGWFELLHAYDFQYFVAFIFAEQLLVFSIRVFQEM